MRTDLAGANYGGLAAGTPGLDHRTAAARGEVADLRTPLSVLLEGERMQVEARSRSARAAAEEIVEELTGERDAWETARIAGLLEELVATERQMAFLALLNYFWELGKCNPWQALRNMLAVTREVAGHLIGGMSQTEVGRLLGLERATQSAHEKRFITELLQRWGARGTMLAGGMKGVSTRQAAAVLAKGNRNRHNGRRRPKESPAGPDDGEVSVSAVLLAGPELPP